MRRQPPPGQQEHLYKLLVIGDLGVGKTSIIKRYVHHNFSPHYRATIGVDFALKVLSWDAETVVRLQLWDIAGQERFGNMTRVYYREAVGAFIVFDVTRPATFEAVTKWKQDLDTKLTLPNGQLVPTVLLANKCDQGQELLVNNGFKMDQFCKDNGFVGWFETSAKALPPLPPLTARPWKATPGMSFYKQDNINIEEAARCLVKHIISSDSQPVHPIKPDVVNPHLNPSKRHPCSACFRT
ncbi:ras-related protein Rab-38 isoform X1 [Thamnophis elegans]|uniref:ras-related protein Rab-38 isoform X1 n=1 Tax=Thamnophis elegans TaxID=35005 RepID=UPI001377F9E4|nr:ras-related protein Rab-38 isoform X1 [Thamnophis elegans]